MLLWCFSRGESQKDHVNDKVNRDPRTGPHRPAEAAAIIESIIVIVLIRSLNYIKPKDSTAQQARSEQWRCYNHLERSQSNMPLLFWNYCLIKKVLLLSPVTVPCCLDALFRRGSEDGFALNPLKCELTHRTSRKTWDHLDNTHKIRRIIRSLFGHSCFIL